MSALRATAAPDCMIPSYEKTTTFPAPPEGKVNVTVSCDVMLIVPPASMCSNRAPAPPEMEDPWVMVLVDSVPVRVPTDSACSSGTSPSIASNVTTIVDVVDAAVVSKP